MTVKLPQKAGFVATTAEWDALVRIAENLAAQVVQRDAESLKATFDAHEKINQLSGDLYGAQMALAQAQAERDAARDEYSAADDDAHKWAAIANEKANALDAARAEVARLTALLFRAVDFIPQHADADEVRDAVDALRQPAPAQTCRECGHHESEHMKVSSKFAIVACSRMNCNCVKPAQAPAQDDQLDDESARLLSETISALSQPAPAQPASEQSDEWSADDLPNDYDPCKCGHGRFQHYSDSSVCAILPCQCMRFTAPAQE